MTESSDPKSPPRGAAPPDAGLPRKRAMLDGQKLVLPSKYDAESKLWKSVPDGLLEGMEMSECFSLMPPAQRVFFWSFIYGVCPERYLEIGTASGGSAKLVMSAILALGLENFHGVCIDPEFEISPRLKEYLEPRFTFFEELSSLKVMKKARQQANGLFDVILVDGDHSYDYALADIALAVPFLRPGGYLLVDDAGYYQVRDAVQYAVESFCLVDAGLMCRHLTPASEWHRVEATGPWAGEIPYMSGLHVLRKAV